jgi:N-hydroxyarylamine O-acetyltransferase
MTLSSIELTQYCERIGFSGVLRPTLETLQTLHRLHPLALTFENLDSWQGHAPDISPDTVFNKLVLQKRGGYCFEQNGLFARVLEAVGYQVYGVSARVLWNQPPEARPPRTHQALVVSLKGQDWLVDVGFGGLTPLGPIRLVAERQQATPLESLRLRASGAGLVLEVLLPQGARPMYWFHPEAALPADFIQSNWFVGAHPSSRFVQHLITTCVRPDGATGFSRHNLIDREYTVYRAGHPPLTQRIASADALRALLANEFALPVDTIPDLPQRLATLF